MSSNINKSVKRKRVNLSVVKKLELIKDIEKGATVKSVCEKYGVKKQTVSDIRKNKEKLEKFAASYCIDAASSKSGKVGNRKHMKTGKEESLDAAVMKWYVQERSNGVNVRGTEILAAARKLAAHLDFSDFKGSEGWLWRFRNRHGLFNKVLHGEAGDADESSVAPFREKLKKLISDEGLSPSQIYNADETGIFWRSMPKNTQIRTCEENATGKKSSKERLSILVGSNATGEHRLKLAVVGKSKEPRAFAGLNIERDLPVFYYHSKKAWFNSAIFSNWFSNHFVPAVRIYQEEVLKISPDEVRAILILDNAPAHPSEDILSSEDGKIKVLFMPPNTTSILQPMDQGVISAMKRHYIRRYLDEVLVVIEDGFVDNRGERTLANIKRYNIRSAIFNFAAAWQDLRPSVLANSWKKLLEGENTETNFEGIEAVDFLHMLECGGEVAISIADVTDWLSELHLDPGYELLSEADIVSSVLGEEEKESTDDEEIAVPRKKLSTLRTYVDALIDYSSYSQLPEMAHHYGSLRMIKELIIKEQHMMGRQRKITSFFTPQSDSGLTTSINPVPCTSQEPMVISDSD